MAEKADKYIVSAKVLILLINLAVIIVLGCLVGYSTNMVKDYKILDSFVDNWNRTMFQEFSVLDAGEACPEGYISIFENEYWPGTETGCECGPSLKKILCSDVDPSYTKSYNCTTIESNPPMKYKQWRKSVVCGKPFYIKGEANLYNYFDISSTSNNTQPNSCPKECGLLDTKSFESLCVSKNSSCPIIKLGIFPIDIGYNPWHDQRKYTEINGTFIRLFYKNVDFSGYSSQMRIASSFLVSSRRSCSDLRYRIYSNKYELYPDTVIESDSSCPQNNYYNSEIEIDEVNLNSFLLENPSGEVVKKLPSYNFNSESNIKLSSVSYVGVKYETRQVIREKYGSEVFLKRLRTDRYNNVLSCIGLVFSCISFILIIIFFGKNWFFNNKVKSIILLLFVLLQTLMSIIEYAGYNLAYLELNGNFVDNGFQKALSENTNLIVISSMPIAVMIMNCFICALYLPILLYTFMSKVEQTENNASNSVQPISTQHQGLNEEGNTQNNYNISLLGNGVINSSDNTNSNSTVPRDH